MQIDLTRKTLIHEFLPAYGLLLIPTLIAQELTVYFFTHGLLDIYFTFSGLRYLVFLSSLMLGGFLLPYITNSDKLKVATVTAVILTFLVRFYVVCNLFECFYLQDPLQPLRLALLVIGLVVLGDSVGVRRRYKSGDVLRKGARPYLLAFSVIYVFAYFPLSTVFAGIAGYADWGGLRLTYAYIIAPLISGLFTLDMFLNRTKAFAAYLSSMILTLLIFATLPCDGCQTSFSLLLVSPLGLLIAGFAGTFGAPFFIKIISKSRHEPSGILRYLGQTLIALLILSLPLTIVVSFRGATPNISVGTAKTEQITAPYVGVYDAIPYTPSCCVEATVIFSNITSATIAPSNYLRAGIGVQAPNRYVDGLDYGYRLDAYLSSPGHAVVEANAWEICDINLACGGVPWQVHMYNYEYDVTFNPGTLNLNLTMQMNPEDRSATWYVNETAIGVFHLPKISLTSFSTGVLPFGSPTWLNFPYGEADFLQFGVESANVIQNREWSVAILNPSYMKNGSWVTIGHAGIIQGPAAFWKVLWVWGGEPYYGVTVKKVTSPELGFIFSYNGTTIPDHYQLW